MSCCTSGGYGRVFSARTAERDAARYDRRGLPSSARWLRDSLVAGGVQGRSLLEVGGGVGGLQIELLTAGATRTTNVELVDSYERAAGRLIAERGLDGRVDRRVADFSADGGGAPAADLVLLHRVICCHPDAAALTDAACARARERIGITIPRAAWWVRAGFAAANAWLRLRRIAFRAYVHPPEQILALAEARGFHPVDRTRGRVWESVVLARDGGRRGQ